MDNIEIVSHPLGGRWEIFCRNEQVGAWADILSRYLEHKGALKDRISAQTRIYKVHFPLLRWDPLWLTKDNKVGVNTIILFGKIIINVHDESIELLLKAPRTHYFSGFGFLMCICKAIETGDVLPSLTAGLIILASIELPFLILRLGFKGELIREFTKMGHPLLKKEFDN